MTEPDLTVEPQALDEQLPPHQVARLRAARELLADDLSDFAHDPDAFDAAWAHAVASEALPPPPRRWTLGATLLVGLATAASLALVAWPEGPSVEPTVAAPDGCRPDGLELAAHQGALSPRELACLDRLVADGALSRDHADRLRLVDRWNRGDIEGWLALAERLALAGDGDADLAYKLLMQQSVLDDPGLVERLSRVVERHNDGWPDDVRAQRRAYVARLRDPAEPAVLPAVSPADTGSAVEPPSPPARATVVVDFPHDAQVQRIDVVCEETPERWREQIVEGQATILRVPTEGVDLCHGILKGPSAPMKIDVAGGFRYLCNIDGLVPRCRRSSLDDDPLEH